MGHRMDVGRMSRDLGAVAEAGVAALKRKAAWLGLGKREGVPSLCCVTEAVPQGRGQAHRQKNHRITE